MKVINGRYKVKQIRSWKAADHVGLKLVERDREILKFINEMKFAGVREIHQRFFKFKADGSVSHSTAWAEERLRQLEKVDYLDSKKFFTDEPRVYFLTKLGYIALEHMTGYREELPAHLSSIDIRQFQHDQLLCRLRSFLESEKLIVSWTSERCLRMGKQITKWTRHDNTPDAICNIAGVGNVALELELSRKTIKRLNARIGFHVSVMKDRRADFHYDSCCVLVGDKYAKRSWSYYADMYGRLFSINEFAQRASVEEIAALIVPKKEAEKSCNEDRSAFIPAPDFKPEARDERSEERVSAH